MAEATTLGTWLRRERERRGVSLTDISEQTKLSVPLLKGLEADDLSRWPGGIFRRAFARSYATAIGVDPDLVVRRVEEEHPSADAEPVPAVVGASRTSSTFAAAGEAGTSRHAPKPTLAIAAVLDLLVAGAIGLGFAAGGSRLLWPVLVIAGYHALGLLISGRSPMLSLILDQQRDTSIEKEPALQPAARVVAEEEPASPALRTDRTPAAATRTPTGRFRQPGRRGSSRSRARA